MRFQVLLVFAILWSVFSAALGKTPTGAERSVADIAADFERLMENQPEQKTTASASGPSALQGAPKTIEQLKYPLDGPVAPANSKDAEIWTLLRSKQAKLRKEKEEILDLIHKRNELLLKQTGILAEKIDKVQAAIIRAIDFNIAYKPKNF